MRKGLGWVTPRTGALRRGSWLLLFMFSFRIHRSLAKLSDSLCPCSVPSKTPPFPPNPKRTTPGLTHPSGPAPPPPLLSLALWFSRQIQWACVPTPTPLLTLLPLSRPGCCSRWAQPYLFSILQDSAKVTSPGSLPWSLHLFPLNPGGLCPKVLFV